ncbi:TPA: hypothetical protein KOR19_001182 [Clostridioides difficile]|uniref:hypothetical protein n=1 Tax=Clostridioides difficile TaxID=1496 RepID=UPI00097FF237|nr:hypothetical protein [Clostridioides difficile]MDL0270294.1 hypothetical protein [Clostridioides difficile]TFZ98500.1 hypothetical protein E5F27_17585 [Clostridioides difficile]TGA05662.1 hypothetical protein E5F38_10210 [Clostridioides difficile]SJR18334.1 Uncharacterised protein [Clostridioides difficile]HBE8999145.1 hypothetical protein [Clostridioides difficile]
MLESDFINRDSYCSYEDLVKLSVKHILNDNINEDDEWDVDNISEIDNGDYQGTLLYLIPKKTYQPNEYEYLMTYVGYGSCSDCDTLINIQDSDSEDSIEDYMCLCKDIICNIIKPYNFGWREDDKYNVVND